MRSFDEIVSMLERELGAARYAIGQGVNDSTLCYMTYGKRTLIVQVWEGAGWEVFVNPGTNKIDETLKWLKSLDEGKP